MQYQTMLALVCAMTAVACGESKEEKSDYSVTIYGEEFIEDTIPADAFADGWAVDFSKFLIRVDAVSLEDETVGESGLVFDLTQSSGGEGHEVLTTEFGDVDHVGYVIKSGSGSKAGNVSDAEVAELDAAGSLLVEGTATKDAVSIDFVFEFDNSTTYDPCEVDADARSAELTIHADHLFYDDLESAEPALRFDLFATADTDADGMITMDDLAGVSIEAEANYQVGSRDITNLAQFVDAQAKTLGHINGEGHCETP